MWTHKDIVTDVFTFQDLLDAHDVLDTRAANEQIYKAWQESLRAQ